MLEWTGERYIPTAKPEEVGAEIHYEHLHRYYFAAQFVKGKVVLDLGCGEGYGSYILSKYAKKVVGVDIDDKSIKHASSTYIRSNLEYRVGSVTSIPVDGEEIFDAVICFEVLEHIAEHEEMLQEVKRVLKKDGIFVVSTPNKKVYSDEPNYQNPFHVKELYFDEFKALLGRYFKHIYFFGQRVYPSSQIWCLTEDNDRSSEFVIERGERSFVRVEAERKEPMYFIAIASDSPLKEIDYRSYLTDVSSVLINNFRKYIRHLEKRLRELEVEVGRLNSIVEQKERQIGDLSASLDKLNTEVAEKSGRVYELENALKIKDGELSRLQQEIESLRSAVRDREAEIERLNDELERISGELKDKNEQVSQLTRSLEEKTKELNEFKVKSINLEQKIRGLEGELKEKESLVERLNGELTAREKAIEELRKEEQRVKSELAAREEQIRNLTEENIRLAAELDSIKSSVTWRAVMKWHSFVERVAPLGTRRRRWYDLGIKGLRVLVNEGFKSFWYRFKEYRVSKKFQVHSVPVSPVTEEREQEEEEIIDTKVSVIIPTKNAGEDFEFTLEKIRNQKGVREIEIIVVDSGSTDNTLEIAKKYGARIFRIKPEEFSHSKVRNFGAEKATGEYLMFTVQDAIPIGERLIYSMIKTIKESGTVVVTCRQIPRADADLYACASLWNHYRTLKLDEDKILKHSHINSLSPIEKRMMCQLDSVCFLIKKVPFMKFKFNETLKYAEDLDLGFRLTKNGYSIAFLAREGVIHSHNRHPLYYLKRSYVDNEILAKILGSDTQKIEMLPLLQALSIVYSSLNSSVKNIRSLGVEEPRKFIEYIKILGRKNLNQANNYTDGPLAEFFQILVKLNKPTNVNNEIIEKVLMAFEHHLNLLHEFLEYYTPSSLEEVESAIYKAFSTIAGSLIANAFGNGPEIEEIKRYLGEGV